MITANVLSAYVSKPTGGRYNRVSHNLLGGNGHGSIHVGQNHSYTTYWCTQSGSDQSQTAEHLIK